MTRSLASGSLATGSVGPPDPDTIDSLVRGERVRALYEKLTVAQATVLLNSLVIVLIIWDRSSGYLLLAWLAAIWVIAATRVRAAVQYRRSTRATRDAAHWERTFVVGAALNGLGWGACPLLLPGGAPLAYRVFLAFVVAGMTAGAGLSSSSHQPAFLAFAIPALAPVTVLFLTAGDRVQLGMAAMLAVFGTAVAAISRWAGGTGAEATRLRFRNADLAERLATSAAELERRVVERTAELERSVAREREAERQLVNSVRLASLGTLAATVAHEVNNPLACVSANLSFVRQEFTRATTDPEVHAALVAALDDADTGLQRVKTIVRFLNDTSRVQLRADVARVDLHATLDFSVAIAEREISARAHLARDYRGTPTVKAGHTCLVQVFLNLLHLATESIPEGGVASHRLRIGTRPDPSTGGVVVEIEHAAADAAGARATRSVEPAGSAAPLLDQTGFELSMCRDILGRFGGRLDTRDDGAGRSFTVWLEAVKGEDGALGSA